MMYAAVCYRKGQFAAYGPFRTQAAAEAEKAELEATGCEGKHAWLRLGAHYGPGDAPADEARHRAFGEDRGPVERLAIAVFGDAPRDVAVALVEQALESAQLDVRDPGACPRCGHKLGHDRRCDWQPRWMAT